MLTVIPHLVDSDKLTLISISRIYENCKGTTAKMISWYSSLFNSLRLRADDDLRKFSNDAMRAIGEPADFHIERCPPGYKFRQIVAVVKDHQRILPTNWVAMVFRLCQVRNLSVLP